MRRFDRYIESEEPAKPCLPLMHTTDGWVLRTLVESGRLTPHDCEVFGSPLLYFFYGRPAYRRTDEDPTSLASYLPVCLIFSPDCLPQIDRIFPFDTGAFSLGLYKQHLHRNMALEHFELSPDISNAFKVVSKFFTNNVSYYNGIAREGLVIGTLDFEASSYYDIVRAEGKTSSDDRRGTIEIQSAHSLEVDKKSILAAILPSIFADEQAILDVIVGKWEAEILPYDVYHFRVSEYTADIFSIAKGFLKDNGFF